ncbi:MAG: DNA polymerase III subunit delta [Chloroflexi bacterium]|nr:DNA polymerase III subunit delta [Chloroflexota bacterium]
MLYVFYGEDSFSRRDAVAQLEEAVGPPEVRDANTTWLSAGGLSLAAIQWSCNAMPFLAQRRLVVIEGFLEQFEPRGRGTATRQQEGSKLPSPWDQLAEHLKGLPPFADVVFLDGPLSEANPALRQLRPVATVQRFTPPQGAALLEWVQRRAGDVKAALEPPAARLLADLVGTDLWTLHHELEKLALYCQGRAVTEADVRALVPQAKEVRVFALTDAVVEGRSSDALKALYQLQEQGEDAGYLIPMLARQVRLLLLCKELAGQGVRQEDLGRRLEVRSGYALRRLLQQAARLPFDRLDRLHARLVEGDLALKTGRYEERLALALLVLDLCWAASSHRQG